MTQKRHVLVLVGGQSPEHEISLISGKSIAETLDPKKYLVSLVGIDRNGCWSLCDLQTLTTHANSMQELRTNKKNLLVLPPGNTRQLCSTTGDVTLPPVDVVFPILHGSHGEDGTMQGLLRLANVPFVGSDVLGSAIGMDKDVMKRLLRDAGLPIAPFLCYGVRERAHIQFETLREKLDLPFFVKSANSGSSIGTIKVSNADTFNAALDEAFLYDDKIIIEQSIVGAEIECAVLGNTNKITSMPARVIPTHDFYSYEAKYLDPHGADFEVPAKLSAEITQRVRDLAIKVTEVLCCTGMARVDFFVTEKNEIFVNEINTIPGFTSVSLYPRMWAESGMSYAELLDQLIILAEEQHEQRQRLSANRMRKTEKTEPLPALGGDFGQ